MGLFDSIRRAVGGGDDGSDETEARPELVDVTALGPDAFRDRAENAASDGAPLDFSVASLARLDEAIAAKDDWTERTPSDGTAYSPKAVQFGSYLGEVLVRTYDGEWAADDGWGVTVAGRDDEVTVDVFEVSARSVAGDPMFAAVAERLKADLELGGTADETDPDGADSETVGDGTQGADETDDADDTATDATGEQANEDVARIAPEDDGETEDDEPPDATGEAADDARNEAVAEEVYPTMDAVEPATESGTTASAGDGAEQSDVDLLGSGAADSDTDQSTVSDAAASAPEDSTVPDNAATDGDVETDTPTAADPNVGAGEPPATTDETDPATETDPTADDGLRAEYATTATEFTDFWTEHDLDFMPSSLARLDDLVGTEWDDDRFSDATFGSEATFDDRAFTSVTTELGSYFGEVLVRELDGEWSADTDHEAVVVVEGTDGPLAVPVFQVAANSLRTVPVFARSYEALLSDLGRDA